MLIVDDEPKIRQLLAKALAEEGHDVVAIDSARAARQLLGKRIFDVLLVDNQMPEVTGLDLIRDITSTMPESERPQILMMTAHATVESAIAAMKLGALDYLQKPFEIDELLVVVERARRAPAPARRSTATCSPSATRSSITTASSARSRRCRTRAHRRRWSRRPRARC